MVSVADTEHAEDDHNHAEKLRQKSMQQNVTNKPTTLVDLFYVEEDGVSRRHHHSSKAHDLKHSYSSVWYKRSAGYTTHTFSEDLKQLTTTFMDGHGNKLRSFTVTKGKSPSPSPGPSPSPTRKFCPPPANLARSKPTLTYTCIFFFHAYSSSRWHHMLLL